MTHTMIILRSKSHQKNILKEIFRLKKNLLWYFSVEAILRKTSVLPKMFENYHYKRYSFDSPDQEPFKNDLNVI